MRGRAGTGSVEAGAVGGWKREGGREEGRTKRGTKARARKALPLYSGRERCVVAYNIQGFVAWVLVGMVCPGERRRQREHVWEDGCVPFIWTFRTLPYIIPYILYLIIYLIIPYLIPHFIWTCVHTRQEAASGSCSLPIRLA
eukprot:354565-Chlamydomonas_euryale.AAC.9